MGGAGSTGAVTSMTSAFSALTNANGTWTLRVTDGCGANIGVVNAATLELAPKCAAQQLAVTAARATVATANAAVPPAAAAAAAADQAVQRARAAVSKATKAVDKAKRKLKKAKASGNATPIKAKKKLRVAKAASKVAQSVVVSAQQGAAAAHREPTTAQAAATAAPGASSPRLSLPSRPARGRADEVFRLGSDQTPITPGGHRGPHPFPSRCPRRRREPARKRSPPGGIAGPHRLTTQPRPPHCRVRAPSSAPAPAPSPTDPRAVARAPAS